MLKSLKAMAITFGIAVAIVTVLVVGALIGWLLLILVAVAIVGACLYVLWLSIIEHLNEES